MKIKVGGDPNSSDLHLVPGENLFTGIKSFVSEFGEINSLEEDLLILAASIYATDLSVKRAEREDYIRTIYLEIELVNYHALERVRLAITNALYTLSKDNWELTFIPKQGVPESVLPWGVQEGATLLFSGGLDSMSGAVKMIQDNTPLVLVSHSNNNKVIEKSQQDVLKLLNDHFRLNMRHIPIKVFGRNKGSYRFPADEERENTQRTRSFLFLTIGSLITRRTGFQKLVFMAENGQFAIHLPLNQSRIGPFSTHTADPEFLQQATNIFQQVLNNASFTIYNPFLYKTKAEVIGIMPEALLKNLMVSVSCWKASRNSEKLHCGECIPCISRRIAIEYNGFKHNEYVVDLFNQNIGDLVESDTGKRNIFDYLEFITKFDSYSMQTKNELLMEFPELYTSSFNQDDALDMYHRMAKQSFKVLTGYKKLKKYFG